jgi:hypothetical protein
MHNIFVSFLQIPGYHFKKCEPISSGGKSDPNQVRDGFDILNSSLFPSLVARE